MKLVQKSATYTRVITVNGFNLKMIKWLVEKLLQMLIILVKPSC